MTDPTENPEVPPAENAAPADSVAPEETTPRDEPAATPEVVLPAVPGAADVRDGPRDDAGAGSGAGGGLGDLLGGLDLGALLETAGEMQDQLAAAQHEAAERELVGVAGGGAVRITVTGGGEFRKVEIAREAVDPDEVDLLCDLVLAALNDLSAQMAALQTESMGGLGGLLGGELGALGDLFGGSGGGSGDAR